MSSGGSDVSKVRPLPQGDTTRKGAELLPLPGQEPERIGGYRVLKELGRGGMGVVYLAESLALGRQVALKVLTARGDVEAVERFLLEARAAARLKHPNVVGVHEVGRDGDRWFLALELVDGESLRARVQRDGPLPPEQAAALLEPIARALHAAHAVGLLHRDVKPANVLVARDGTPLLADFGLAKDVAADGVTVTGEVMGTPAYMAPEQAAADHARVDRRADVYGLGATLYEALTGRPPFAGGSALAVLRRVADEAPAPPSRLRPGLDLDLETICLTCLEKAPDARYDTAQALADDLGRWLRHEPVSVRRPGLPGRALRWARRRPDLAAGAGALLLALVVAGSVVAALELADRQRVREARRGAEAAAVAAVASGDPLERTRRASEARAAARRWFDAAKTDGEARALLAEAAARDGQELRALRQYGAAHLAFDEAAKLLPERADLVGAALACLRIQEAEHCKLVGRFDQALDACAQALLARPDWPDSWLVRVLVHALSGDARSSLSALDEALRVAPDDVLALQFRAYKLLEAGDARGALRDLDRAVALDPMRGQVFVQRATAHRALQELDLALADADSAVTLDRSPTALALRSRLKIDRGDPVGAQQDTLEALTLRPGDGLLLAQLGLLRREQRARPEEVLEVMDQAVAASPDRVEVRLARAQAREDAGDRRGALEDVEAAARGRPDDMGLVLRQAHLHALLGDLAEAEAGFDRAVRASDGPTVALVGRGEVRLNRGDYARARDDAAAVLQLDATSAEALWIRGMALLRLGQDAAPDLERYLTLVPPDHPRAVDVRGVLKHLRRGR